MMLLMLILRVQFKFKLFNVKIRDQKKMGQTKILVYAEY